MSKTIADLRQMLFAQMADLDDQSKPLDVKRHQLKSEVARNIIETAKIEVAYAAIIKGALDMPFIEGQASERLNGGESSLTAKEKAERLLDSPAHPWRGLTVAKR